MGNTGILIDTEKSPIGFWRLLPSNLQLEDLAYDTCYTINNNTADIGPGDTFNLELVTIGDVVLIFLAIGESLVFISL